MYHKIREIICHSNKQKCIRALNFLMRATIKWIVKNHHTCPNTLIFCENGVTCMKYFRKQEIRLRKKCKGQPLPAPLYCFVQEP